MGKFTMLQMRYPSHTSSKYNHHILLLRAESTYLRNLYQHPTSNRKFDFPIPSQAYSTCELTKTNNV